MGHPHTYASVNVKVDVGIAPIIDALAMFPALETIESCQGSDDHSVPWICFRYGENWRSLAEFVFSFFGPELMRRVNDAAAVSVRYWMGSGSVLAEMTVRPDGVEIVAAAIAEMASAFPDAVSRRVLVAGLTQGEHATEDIRPTCCQVVNLPVGAERDIASSRVMTAGLHRTLALATGALVNVIAECHRSLSFLPHGGGSELVTNVPDEPGRQNDSPLETSPMAASVPSDCSGTVHP